MSYLLYAGVWFSASTVFALAWGSLCRLGGEQEQAGQPQQDAEAGHSLTA